MGEVQDFLSEVLPRFRAAADAMHNGDAAPFAELWSRSDPVTLLGAAMTAPIGWASVTEGQKSVASQFSNGTPLDFELVAADARGDMAYTVGYERSSVSVHGGPARPAFLRATQIYRREDGEWKLVHRHADPVPGAGSPSTDALKNMLSSPDEDDAVRLSTPLEK
jgi:ketosteroid isomerase-like protein